MTAATQSSAQTSNAPHSNVAHMDMANAIRALSMDAVQRANSGHPGMPMGMADVVTVLFQKFMKFNAADGRWADRDRFILSAGHGSMLLYSLGYLLGYPKMTLDEIKNFRQLHSLTPGHPEIMPEVGIETTTGPLGQGISAAAGFALGERIMNANFGDALVDHYTYVIAGDGCMMEGISHEACSLAGHLKLSKLIVLYDDNGITIDGPTELSFTDDTNKRFESYGWDVQEIDGHDPAAIEAAIAHAKTTHTPSMIACKTKIGFGAPTKEDSSAAHGSPLGDEEIQGARKNIGWAHAPFEIPTDVLEAWRAIGNKGAAEQAAWENRLEAASNKDQFTKWLAGDWAKELTSSILDIKQTVVANKAGPATRKASGDVLDVITEAIPALIGGSADLTGSNNTYKKGNPIISADTQYDGQYIYYGVREHGMAAMMNGLAQHGGLIPYSGTFLTFSDYCRPSIRLAALMKTQVVHVMTHDSIGLGEDGPTHQAVEHVAALRAIPNCFVYRPCDGVEAAECWQAALEMKDAPAVMALTRQGLPTLREDATEDNKSAKGAYVLRDNTNDNEELDVILMASGSEVSIAAEAYDTLSTQGKKVRLISAPCLDLFAQQDDSYMQKLLGHYDTTAKRICVEAAVQQSWDRFIRHGKDSFIGMTGFGESAPADELYIHFGITTDAIVKAATS